MEESKNPGALGRAASAAANGAKGAVKTIWFLLRVIVPVSLAVALLGWSGILERISTFLAPFMRFLGLSGEAALVFISGALLNNYSAIAVATSIPLDLRQMTILALMCLTAHNLLIETAVMRKAGSSAAKMAILRLAAALVSAVALNFLLPASLGSVAFSAASSIGDRPAFWAMLLAWLASTGKLAVKIVLIVLAIMIAQRLLEEFKVMDLLSRIFSPLMKIFGLGEGSSFLWIVINIVGYAYGAGIVVEEIESGKMKAQDGDLFNHHAALCHSLLEDTALYAALGLPLFWITVPRLVLAFAAVWLERGRRHFVRRSFRVGTR